MGDRTVRLGIENMNGTIRRVCRVKRLKDATMAMRWTGAAMMEAAKGFRWLKACKQLSALRAALTAHQLMHTMNSDIEDQALAAWAAQPVRPAKHISTKAGAIPQFVRQDSKRPRVSAASVKHRLLEFGALSSLSAD